MSVFYDLCCEWGYQKGQNEQSSGCHGNIGQDPEAIIHLLQTYALTVLACSKHLDCLEKFTRSI